MEITDNLPSSEVQSAAPASPATEEVVSSAEKVYPMSRQGRRQAFILLAGVISIWIFALWTLITILQDGLSGVEWVSMLLMLGLLVVAPVVAWALLEEANSRIAVSDQGIKYQTLAGISLTYSWDALSGPKLTGGRGRLARFFLGDNDVPPAEVPDGAGDTEDEEEPETLSLQARNDHAAQITNPAARLLHKLAHGASLPIYGGLENRQELMNRIRDNGKTIS